MNRRCSLLAWGGTVVAALMTALPVSAQPAPGMTLHVTDTAMAIVPLRPLAEIDGELELVEVLLGGVQQHRRDAENARLHTQSYLQLRKGELDLAKRELDMVKRDGDKMKEVELDAQKRALEDIVRYLEREKSLKDSEFELSKKNIERSEALNEALSVERDLAIKRAQVTGEVDPVTAQVISDLERRTLEAQKRRYELEKDVADRGKKVTEDRLKLLEARSKLIVSG